MPDDEMKDRGANHYEVLGVGVGASTSEIHRAYVRLARLHHPDFFVSAEPPRRAEAETRMRRVNVAWSILGDAAMRRTYDESIGLRNAVAVDTNTPFRPFDNDDDDPDPLTLPDIPYRSEPEEVLARRGFARMLAPVALALAALLVTFAFFTGSGALLRVSVVIFGLAGAGFVAMPLFALLSSKRDEG
ncbi:MAG: J domain-containing protein [Actinobacteria bacterium]|nr:J domain-containing protein [Actinomycetota bacterium]